MKKQGIVGLIGAVVLGVSQLAYAAKSPSYSVDLAKQVVEKHWQNQYDSFTSAELDEIGQRISKFRTTYDEMEEMMTQIDEKLEKTGKIIDSVKKSGEYDIEVPLQLDEDRPTSELQKNILRLEKELESYQQKNPIKYRATINGVHYVFTDNPPLIDNYGPEDSLEIQE